MGFEPMHGGLAEPRATRTPDARRPISSIDQDRRPPPLDNSGWQRPTYTPGPLIADVTVDPASYP